MCQARVSNKSVLQECFRVLRESVLPECATRVSSKSVRPECLTRVSHKSVPQECLTRVCHKSVTQECPTRLSEKSVKQEYSTRVAFNAMEHLLFALYCSVGALLLRELLVNAFGFVASIRLLFTTIVAYYTMSLCALCHRVFSSVSIPFLFHESTVCSWLAPEGCLSESILAAPASPSGMRQAFHE